jgi:hypothetical protein
MSTRYSFPGAVIKTVHVSALEKEQVSRCPVFFTFTCIA